MAWLSQSMQETLAKLMAFSLSSPLSSTRDIFLSVANVCEGLRGVCDPTSEPLMHQGASFSLKDRLPVSREANSELSLSPPAMTARCSGDHLLDYIFILC